MTVIGEDVRERFRAVADQLIPEAEGMPSASSVGVADGQLDKVLEVRPDLEGPFLRALDLIDSESAVTSIEELSKTDPEAYEAMTLVTVGGYYIVPEIRQKLNYDGQEPVEVKPAIIPHYVDEGLIDAVLQKGTYYRRIPGEDEPDVEPIIREED
jgi:hypothetical protein